MNEYTIKVAVVTGAASGIGLALATRFANEGMKVVLADVVTPGKPPMFAYTCVRISAGNDHGYGGK